MYICSDSYVRGGSSHPGRHTAWGMSMDKMSSPDKVVASADRIEFIQLRPPYKAQGLIMIPGNIISSVGILS
jgi:hypothetical protein